MELAPTATPSPVQLPAQEQKRSAGHADRSYHEQVRPADAGPAGRETFSHELGAITALQAGQLGPTVPLLHMLECRQLSSAGDLLLRQGLLQAAHHSSEWLIGHTVFTRLSDRHSVGAVPVLR